MKKKLYDRPTFYGRLIACIISIIVIGLHYYVALPVINIHAPSFYTTLIFYIGVYVVSSGFFRNLFAEMGDVKVITGKKIISASKDTRVGITIIALLVAMLVIGAISSAAIFNAGRLSSRITITEADFIKDMPETTEVTNIALMDSESAGVIGTRALGSLSDVVSQYELSGTYTQIDYKGKPMKVSNLEYNGFFKWWNNKSGGVPGYVMVDPIKNTADYKKLEKPLKYVESAYFSEDLDRKLRFSYPTKIFGEKHFEIDEEGNPYYIVPCLTSHAGLFGAMDVEEIIIFNPVNGSSELKKVKDVPNWVDTVFDGDLASKKYNWYGKYSGGFWNSLIGQKNCTQATDDYGYLMLGGDVWYYTGVTSVLADDSNIGFILTNARTGEYKFYPIIGAEEFSAMSAAEGEVQEKGYEASFPSLINVANQASYIMVLKDNSGLVKQYAVVNVENYSVVATAPTQIQAIAAYKRLLVEKGIISSNVEIVEPDVDPEGNVIETKKATTCIADINLVTIDGNTYIYLTGEDKHLYRQMVKDDETLLFIKQGDECEIEYTEGDNEVVRLIKSVSVKGSVPVATAGDAK